jgi:hypothetical protein
MKLSNYSLTQSDWVTWSFDNFNSTFDMGRLTLDISDGQDSWFSATIATTLSGETKRGLAQDLAPDRRFIEFFEHDPGFVYEVGATFGPSGFAVNSRPQRLPDRRI